MEMRHFFSRLERGVFTLYLLAFCGLALYWAYSNFREKDFRMIEKTLQASARTLDEISRQHRRQIEFQKMEYPDSLNISILNQAKAIMAEAENQDTTRAKTNENNEQKALYIKALQVKNRTRLVQTLRDLSAHMHTTDFPMQAVLPLLYFPKSCPRAGETFRAEAALHQYSVEPLAEVAYFLDGKPVASERGLAKFQLRFDRPGLKKFTIESIIKNRVFEAYEGHQAREQQIQVCEK